MLLYTIHRLGQTLLTALGISILVFLALHLAPGDPAVMIGGPDATERELAIIRELHGLNRALPFQYLNWAGRVLAGDLGMSYRGRRPVAPDLVDAFKISTQLALGALAFAVVVGIPVGLLAALQRDRPLDMFTMGFSVLGMSMPVFWLALLLILVFSLRLRVLPSSGWGSVTHAVLPVFVLSLSTLALVARMTRTTVAEVLLEDFVRTAHAKGLARGFVLYKHVLPNVWPTIATTVGLRLGALLGGAVITETVFSVPGLGRLIVQAVNFRDLPVVQGGVLVIALGVGLVNLVVDLMIAATDPRIRYA